MIQDRQWPIGSYVQPGRAMPIIVDSRGSWTLVDCTDGRQQQLLTDRVPLCLQFLCRFGVSLNVISTTIYFIYSISEVYSE